MTLSRNEARSNSRYYDGLHVEAKKNIALAQDDVLDEQKLKWESCHGHDKAVRAEMMYSLSSVAMKRESCLCDNYYIGFKIKAGV